MIAKKEPKEFEKDKYYIDLDDVACMSRSHYYYISDFILRKELKYTSKEMFIVRETLDKKGVTFDKLLKEVDKLVGDYVVFFHGGGDGSKSYTYEQKLIKGTPYSKRTKSSGRKKKSSQDALTENMRKAVAKDYGLKE